MLTFDDTLHRYLLDGKPVPSVTQIISDILGQQWYAADWYLQRGRAVHACAAFIARGVEFDYDPQIEGQVQALRVFFDQVTPEVIATETPLASTTYRFAGTPDLLGKMNRRYTLFDYKASMDTDRTALQLGAYSVLLEENRMPKGVVVNVGYGVEIKEDGRYRMTEALDLRQARREFLALRTVHRIKERMNLLERGDR